MSVRACVLAGFGLNCDVETTEVLRLAGAEAERLKSLLTEALDRGLLSSGAWGRS